MSNVAEPIKDYFRNLAMTHLIYIYGGMVVPNSLVCLKSLKPLYDECVLTKKPFVCEKINKTTKNLLFLITVQTYSTVTD